MLKDPTRLAGVGCVRRRDFVFFFSPRCWCGSWEGTHYIPLVGQQMPPKNLENAVIHTHKNTILGASGSNDTKTYCVIFFCHFESYSINYKEEEDEEGKEEKNIVCSFIQHGDRFASSDRCPHNHCG